MSQNSYSASTIWQGQAVGDFHDLRIGKGGQIPPGATVFPILRPVLSSPDRSACDQRHFSQTFSRRRRVLRWQFAHQREGQRVLGVLGVRSARLHLRPCGVGRLREEHHAIHPSKGWRRVPSSSRWAATPWATPQGAGFQLAEGTCREATSSTRWSGRLNVIIHSSSALGPA